MSITKFERTERGLMEHLGFLKSYNSIEVKESCVSIGFECLDRELFNPEKCYDLLAKTSPHSKGG